MNAQTKIEGGVRTPYGSVVRMRAAQSEVHDQFEKDWQKLLADKEAKLRAINDKFWRGGFA